MIFRIDDVSVNTNFHRLVSICDVIVHCQPKCKILVAVSPLVHNMENEPERDQERAFPRILSATSDHRELFRVGLTGAYELTDGIDRKKSDVASHGLFHVDHRLLGREAQEMSILASCSLLKTKTFVPPFNKWNKDTESVCAEHGIELIKFEDGWKHVNYNKFDPTHEKWYLHTHDTSAEKLEEWFRA